LLRVLCTGALLTATSATDQSPSPPANLPETLATVLALAEQFPSLQLIQSLCQCLMLFEAACVTLMTATRRYSVHGGENAGTYNSAVQSKLCMVLSDLNV
jgi:hypothetical protein